MAARLEIPEDAKILVVDLAFIGDLLMSTPALANLRRGFPKARMEILVDPQSRPVIERNPSIDRVITSTSRKGSLAKLGGEAAVLAGERYDLGISFHRGHGSLMMLRKAGIPRRIGFTNGGRFVFLTGGIPFEIQRHRAWNHLRLIERCLSIDVDYNTLTEMVLDPTAVASIDERLKPADGARLVGINPNAAWPTRRWLPEGFAYVADRVSDFGRIPVLIGSPRERGVCNRVKARMKTRPLDFTGETTIDELAALLARCEILVTNDTGPMHIAHALGTPTLPVFGPTDPQRCRPWLGKIAPLQAELDCVKCYRKRCWHLSCMKNLGPEEVAQAALACIRLSPDT